MRIAIIAITANGARMGDRLKSGIPDSNLFVIEKHAKGEVQQFSSGLQPLVEHLWPEYQGFVFVMATGIVVRTVAPLLKGKDLDPAIVVIDDAGRFAISLLSGHIGGANQLASLCAEITGSLPVITTATDVNDLPSFDMLAKDHGWLIEDLSKVKVLNAMLLEGKEIAVLDETGCVRDYCGGKARLCFHADFAGALDSSAAGALFVTNKIVPQHRSARNLVLRPLNLCLGIGCNRGTSSEEIESVVMKNLARLSLSVRSVKCLATAQAKGNEQGLLACAAKLGVPLMVFDHDALNGIDVPSPASAHAFAAIGAKGVAEPAALLASGGGGLILNKVKDGNVTLAIAQVPSLRKRV